jgi:hypothetical protein
VVPVLWVELADCVREGPEAGGGCHDVFVDSVSELGGEEEGRVRLVAPSAVVG